MLLDIRYCFKLHLLLRLFSNLSPMIGIYIRIMESQREANTGSPQKQSFCGVKSLPYIIDSPSPYQGEGDKGDRVTNKNLKGGEVDKESIY